VVYGIDSDYLSISSANISNGKNLDPEKQDELVINKSMLEAVGYKDVEKAVGASVSINFKLQDDSIVEKKFIIKGIVDDTTDSEVFISKHIFPGLGQDVYSQAKVVARDREDISQLRAQIESTGFTTSSPVDTLDEVTKVFRIFNLVLVAFSSIGMFIAVLGMLNTLTVSLLERTREIALMVTLGARPRDIRRLFNLEAVILSLVGGAAGILLASSTGLLLNVVINALAHDRGVAKNVSLFAVPILLVFGTLTAISLIGLAVSYFPAKRAAKLNPIEALRVE
jgi:putative ABC transport system permease protein